MFDDELSKNDMLRAKFLLYEEKVRKLSDKIFKKEFFEHREFRGNGLELDHKLSIYDGFYQGVPIEIMSDPANLQLIPINENREKSSRSTISFEELINEISERESLLEPEDLH